MSNDHSFLPKPDRSVPAGSYTGNRLVLLLKQWFAGSRILAAAYPSTVIKIRLHDEVPWPVKALQTNDRIYIHAGEVVPCDSILATDTAVVDYSLFTSGYQVERRRGELIYAGGKIVEGQAILKVHESMTPRRFVYLLKLRKRQYREMMPKRQPSVQMMLLNAFNAFVQRIASPGKTVEKHVSAPDGTIRYEGLPLSKNDMQLVLFAVSGSKDRSLQTIGQEMQQHVRPGRFKGKVSILAGEGVSIGHLLQLGNAAFVGTHPGDGSETEIWLRIDSRLMGKFVLGGTAIHE
jgi:hypothetical protein